MSGAAIARKVARGIAKAGARVGDGAPLSATIMRLNDQTAPTSYPPPKPDDTGAPDAYDRFPCTVMISEYSARDRAGTEITVKDVKVLMSPDVFSDPRNGDRLQIGADTYHLINVMAVNPGGVVLMWECQARKS